MRNNYFDVQINTALHSIKKTKKNRFGKLVCCVTFSGVTMVPQSLRQAHIHIYSGKTVLFVKGLAGMLKGLITQTEQPGLCISSEMFQMVVAITFHLLCFLNVGVTTSERCFSPVGRKTAKREYL